MDLEKINSIVKKLHPGASYNVKYIKDGVFKIRPVRLGVRYAHIKNVKQSCGLPGNGHWVIDRFVYQDSNGYKLRITNGAFGSPRNKPIVQCIKLENVVAIIRRGEEL